jgi:hypothetical protein
MFSTYALRNMDKEPDEMTVFFHLGEVIFLEVTETSYANRKKRRFRFVSL